MSAPVCYTVMLSPCPINFSSNIHKRHTMARPWGRDMECLLWVRSLIYIPHLSLSHFMWYPVMIEYIMIIKVPVYLKMWLLSWHIHVHVFMKNIDRMTYNQCWLLSIAIVRFYIWHCTWMYLLCLHMAIKILKNDLIMTEKIIFL